MLRMLKYLKLTWPPLFFRIFFRYLLSVSTMILLMMSKLLGFIPISKTCSLMSSFTAQVPKTRSNYLTTSCSTSFDSVTGHLPHLVLLKNKSWNFITVLISWCCRLRSWSLNAKYLGLARVSSTTRWSKCCLDGKATCPPWSSVFRSSENSCVHVRLRNRVEKPLAQPSCFIVRLKYFEFSDFLTVRESRVVHSLKLDLWASA